MTPSGTDRSGPLRRHRRGRVRGLADRLRQRRPAHPRRGFRRQVRGGHVEGRDLPIRLPAGLHHYDDPGGRLVPVHVPRSARPVTRKGHDRDQRGRLIIQGEKGRGVATVLRSPNGDLIMDVQATLSDNSIVTAKLSLSP